MKGLIYKDVLLCFKNMRALFLLNIVYLVCGVFGEAAQFFLLFTCVMIGVQPMSLQSLDESYGWPRFAAALPVTRAQVVSARYLVSIFYMVLNWGVCVLALLIGHSINGLPLQIGAFLSLAVPLSMSVPMLSLPILFRFGAQRGRLIYIVCISLVCGVMGAVGGVAGNLSNVPHIGLYWAPLIGAALYALSWQLSIWLYKRREL